jgi:hypothetical protein
MDERRVTGASPSQTITYAMVIGLVVVGIVVALLLLNPRETPPQHNTHTQDGYYILREDNGVIAECPKGEVCVALIDYTYQGHQPTRYGTPGEFINDGASIYLFADELCRPENRSQDPYDGAGCNVFDAHPNMRQCDPTPSWTNTHPPCPTPTLISNDTASVETQISPTFLVSDPEGYCVACRWPNVCEVGGGNTQLFNHDNDCLPSDTNPLGGGAGCNFQNMMGCRLCSGPNEKGSPFPPCVGTIYPDGDTPSDGSCKSNSDCNSGFTCRDGSCVTSVCTSPSECGDPSIWNCDGGQCVKKCCVSDLDCPDPNTQCKDRVCRLKQQPEITVRFKNETNKIDGKGVTLLIGAVGPSPVLPSSTADPLNPWNLAPGEEMVITIPDDWKQTSQAATPCNDGVVGPRFWARTGCLIGDPYWTFITPTRTGGAPFVPAAADPPSDTTVGDGRSTGTYILGTRWVNTTTKKIFYKSYGSRWVELNNTFTSGLFAPLSSTGSLGDIHRVDQTDTSEERWYIKTRKAQCDTGDCANNYDCSLAGVAGENGTSLAEFCFVCGDLKTYYDVSLVDGYNLSIDITPVGGIPDPNDPFSNITNLCKSGIDMREAGVTQLNGHPAEKFFLHANQSRSAYQPTTTSGDRILSVFSNCGYYEYPTAPSQTCDPNTDEKCRLWRQFCCQSSKYGNVCKSDSDCDNGGACWNGVCSCKAWYGCTASGQPVPQSTPIDDNNSFIDPVTNQREWKHEYVCCPNSTCFESYDPAAQPIPGHCDQGTGECIGDDFTHSYCPKAYSWPNDPTTFNSTAKSYIITFSPGGTNYNGTLDINPIPLCSDLASLSSYYPSTTPSPQGSVYACIPKRLMGDPQPLPWSYDIQRIGSSCQSLGTLCRQ